MQELHRLMGQTGGTPPPGLGAQSIADSEAMARRWLDAQLGLMGIGAGQMHDARKYQRADDRRTRQFAALSAGLGGAAGFFGGPQRQPQPTPVSRAYPFGAPQPYMGPY